MSNDQDHLPASRASMPGPRQGPGTEMGNRTHTALSESVCGNLQLWDWGQLWPRSQLSASGECLVGFPQMEGVESLPPSLYLRCSCSIPRLAQRPWCPIPSWSSWYSSKVSLLGSQDAWDLVKPDPQGLNLKGEPLVQHTPLLTRDLLVNLVQWKVIFPNRTSERNQLNA